MMTKRDSWVKFPAFSYRFFAYSNVAASYENNNNNAIRERSRYGRRWRRALLCNLGHVSSRRRRFARAKRNFFIFQPFSSHAYFAISLHLDARKIVLRSVSSHSNTIKCNAHSYANEVRRKLSISLTHVNFTGRMKQKTELERNKVRGWMEWKSPAASK